MNYSEKYGLDIMDIRTFICFSAKDRYCIAEPIVYHLKNYGIDVWYDRQRLLMGDDRIEKNLIEGVTKCKYAIIIVSKNTVASKCAMEELNIIKKNYFLNSSTVFPILYEIKPSEIPTELTWVKRLIFKEVTRDSGTYEVCNHIACKLTEDILKNCRYHTLNEIVSSNVLKNQEPINKLLCSYTEICNENLNGKITLLYTTFIFIETSINNNFDYFTLVKKIFLRIFNESKLNILVDYRDIWLLENAISILLNFYIEYFIDSRT